ncbi:MAG: atypical dual specificity phosphatase [Polyangiales bacterium]|jgi:atypical dual specificity phosphatase
MSFRDQLTSRLVALLGLDFDFAVDLRRKRFSEINDTLFVGRRPLVDDLVELRELGITHVISCLPERERFTVDFLAADFRCLFVPVHDGIREDISTAFPKVFDFARALNEHPAQTERAKLLIHCEVGVSRSATLAIALLMNSEKGTFFDTFTQVHARRPEILPNIGFASQLQHLEHTMHPRAKGKPSSLTQYLRDVCNVPVGMELLQESLEQHDFDAPRAIRAIFGDEIPRVVQGVRL